MKPYGNAKKNAMDNIDNHIDVLFEDNHLLVLNKPAGLLTQPTDECQDSLESRAKAWLKSKYKKPGNVFLHVAHRLDKPVSGIVICCKTGKALSRLNASIRSKEIKKTYIALVEGELKSRAGTLENYLKHDDFRAFVCTPDTKEAKFARLHYKVLKTLNLDSAVQDAKSGLKAHTLLEIALETGRYHQIRCQCANAGFPIVGDEKYGAKRISSHQIALHHARLEMVHPVTRELLKFEAPPGIDLI